MKANELMIGDWVQFHTECYEPYSVEFVQRKISNFTKYGLIYFDDCMAYSEEEGIYATRQYDKIEPIPLTEKILKENGFEKKQLDDSFIYSKEIGRYCIVFFSENGCPYLTIEDVEDIEQHHTCIELKDEVYNVHELQHALRLCGLHEMADNFKLK